MDDLFRIVLVLILVGPLIAALVVYLIRRRVGSAIDAHAGAPIENESRRWRGVGWLVDVVRTRVRSRKGY
jgi:hypothetical protein